MRVQRTSKAGIVRLMGCRASGAVRRRRVKLLLAAAFAIAAATALLSEAGIAAAQEPGSVAAADEEKLTIKDVMVKAHKKPDELLKKVATGSATQEQKDQLVKLYKAMASQKPPKGDAEVWNEKTKLLVDAASAVAKGSPDASRRLVAAANCMSCHRDHK